jgi:hypothetical protein
MNPLKIGSGHRTLRVFMTACLASLSLFTQGSSLAEPVELGRLFYTPAQRAQLETARSQNVTRPTTRNKGDTSVSASAPLRYDGVLIRSDGTTTRWVDGKAQTGASSVLGLKPGQIRADGKVYEPYQVLRPVAPSPAAPSVKELAP